MLSGVRRPLGLGTPGGSGVFHQINDSAANSLGSIGLGRMNPLGIDVGRSASHHMQIPHPLGRHADISQRSD